MGDGEVSFHHLGKRELGTYAFEKQWPNRIATIVQYESTDNEAHDVVPKLARLLERDSEIDVAYLCHQDAVQVYKISGEGHHFCGYRNLQMLLLSIASLGTLPIFNGGYLMRKMNVPQLQDAIEAAWDAGINPHGRVLTGGIKETRKHIGTSEAEALLLSFEIPCTGTSFEGQHACRKLFDYIEAYFAQPGGSSNRKTGVVQTQRPSIFLQRPNHSVTIIGIEVLKSGKRRLLTFDPAYDPPSAVLKEETIIRCSKWTGQRILWRYRRPEDSMQRFKMFETLTFDQIVVKNSPNFSCAIAK